MQPFGPYKVSATGTSIQSAIGDKVFICEMSQHLSRVDQLRLAEYIVKACNAYGNAEEPDIAKSAKEKLKPYWQD